MKALVVDDDVVSRMALIDLLSVYGLFDLVEAEDGDVALQKLADGLRPVICFCDVRMPRMSGIDLLERMKQMPGLGDVPFVLVSSASDRETVLQAVKLGAVGYILKPLHAADARAHLEKIFRVTLDKLAESPAATQKRLNIGAERLLAYLNAFGEQLVTARSDVAPMAEAGKGADLRARVDAVHAGCMTLGLWHVAGLVENVRAVIRGGTLDLVRLDEAFAEVLEAVDRQRSRLQAAADAPGALA
jgi:two-component system chemotaxis response regulator CheY